MLSDLRIASDQAVSERVVPSIRKTFAGSRAVMAKWDIYNLLDRTETARGLRFDLRQSSAGTNPNQAPNDYVSTTADVMSLDFGGILGKYFGDLCLM